MFPLPRVATPPPKSLHSPVASGDLSPRARFPHSSRLTHLRGRAAFALFIGLLHAVMASRTPPVAATGFMPDRCVPKWLRPAPSRVCAATFTGGWA